MCAATVRGTVTTKSIVSFSVAPSKSPRLKLQMTAPEVSTSWSIFHAGVPPGRPLIRSSNGSRFLFSKTTRKLLGIFLAGSTFAGICAIVCLELAWKKSLGRWGSSPKRHPPRQDRCYHFPLGAGAGGADPGDIVKNCELIVAERLTTNVHDHTVGHDTCVERIFV